MFSLSVTFSISGHYLSSSWRQLVTTLKGSSLTCHAILPKGSIGRFRGEQFQLMFLVTRLVTNITQTTQHTFSPPLKVRSTSLTPYTLDDGEN